MAKKENLNKVLILGSGPIVIGQACEFDYSGTQACKALMKEGLEVILVNSNPATIMTDPDLATRVYIEPLEAMYVEQVIAKERPQAIIPTLGGQTALNLALELYEKGILDRYKVEMLGARPSVIRAAEDREQFRALLDRVGAKYPKSFLVRTYEEGLQAAEQLGLPLILRPNYTLGGGGGGIAYSLEDYKSKLVQALHESPSTEVLVEESILGWKEFELEVMRDHAGTFVVVCSIENFDPCGVHTGDSITVAPQQTLDEEAYQQMRDEARRIIEEVGIETGGANIQFAVHPETGERVVIEMNPRVSRSSALASKATGFPIAKIAALLAIGYRLDEISNDITGTTPSCYEPSLDYVVTKIPRFAFEKFSGARDHLSTQMRSVGEVMAVGRTFKESLQKALLSLEKGGLSAAPVSFNQERLVTPNSQRIFQVFQAFRESLSVSDVYNLTQITPWFLEQIKELVDFETKMADWKLDLLNPTDLRKAKKYGFSDASIASVMDCPADQLSTYRHKHGIRPCFFQVDTCAAEFKSETPYYYSTYHSLSEGVSLKKDKSSSETIAVIGSGPNRIGQGIEFDYSCVRGVKRLRALGYEVAMINSNPETVSTDYDTADLLFFEPLTPEHVSEVLSFIGAKGFVSQLGGQTPIYLAPPLVKLGFNLLGSSLDSVDLAEDRARFSQLCRDLHLEIPKAALVKSYEEAREKIDDIGFPILCRPSYVLGGRRMEIIENEEELESYFERHKSYIGADRPCQLDQFLEGALEVDVDVVRGKDWSFIGGIVEHIEAAGVHSGDSMGVLPPQRLKEQTSKRIEAISLALADKLKVLGFLNLQLAVKDDVIYVLEANPRSSRTVPFIAKATSIPLVDIGIDAIMGRPLPENEKSRRNWEDLTKVCVKGVALPFKKFPESDSLLGPEMKSTGESMGRADTYPEALLKAIVSTGTKIPTQGEVFLSWRDKDKPVLLPLAKDLLDLGFTLSATRGTCSFLRSKGLTCDEVKKVQEGRPHCVDRIRSGEIALVINTTSGRKSIEESFSIRRSCIDYSVPCVTESDTAFAFVLAIRKFRESSISVEAL